ncbi:glycosyltransferase family 39 protein [bacterium SCSIO 12741]|nr:glycosyltransferase family 39 protein [bacterium SCSIO 12741]
MINTPRQRDLLLITCVALCLRWLMMPWAETVDADAVSRIFLAKQWAAHPDWISEGVWGPFHFYLFGSVFWLTDDHVWASTFLQTVISGLTAIPLYLLGSRLYGRVGGWACALFLVANPVILHNSFQGLSFPPFALFTAWSMYYFQRAMASEGKEKDAFYAGLFLTIASGFRFEAWILMALFAGFLLWKKGWKSTLSFGLIAASFPLIWMAGNWSAHNNPLYSITPYQTWWNESLTDAQKNPIIWWKRRLFFPLSLTYLVQPILGLFFIAMSVYLTLKKKWRFEVLIWWVPLLVFLVLWMLKVINGSMFMQHRFTSILLLLLAPLIGILTQAPGKRWINHSLLFLLIAINIPASFRFRSFRIENFINQPKEVREALFDFREMGLEQTTAIPRLKSGKVRPWVQKLQAQRLENPNGLILDFMGWEETYHLAFTSGWHPDNILLIPGGWEGDFNPDAFKYFFDRSNNLSGTLLIQKNSKFDELFGPDTPERFFEGRGIRVELIELDRDEEFILYNYTWKKTT